MNNNLIENRQIRVFISSTFRDMQDERDYLMKRTFPKLRKLAAERDVTLTELDLRWGITEEESKSGKVVEICLREIENSIPFFIGIIGNRYGWVPSRDDLGGNVTERFTDVNKYIEQHLSVTEMEMQFGVLNRDEDMYAYFYIKEQEENPEKVDYPEMLSRLKQEVCKSKYPSSTYKSPEDLAAQVEEAFINLLDSLFPQGNLSELEKERIGQRSFLNQLCQNYIKDEKNFEVLDTWLADENSHQFVVTGTSGLGKSALIANWLKEKLSATRNKYNFIYHFTGNGGSESSSEHITKSIANEIKDIYGWEENGYDEKTNLDELFLRVSAEGNKPLLIVIDAINQIVDVDNAKLLNWLPIPTKGVKIIFSTLEDDRTMDVFKNRKYPIFTLQPLDIEHRSQLVRSYLKLYAKSLTEQQVERIVSDSQCENTLVLKTLLDELINFGIHEKLNERIDYYLAAETINDFYQKLLESYEEEYREYSDNFVKIILSLIAVSRNGLSEEEIISIADIKPLHWSQFYCSFLHHFTNKNGLISFSHFFVSEAIAFRYLNDSKHKNEYCSNIIKYFDGKEYYRAWNELAHQYKKCGYYNNLWSLFSKSDVMSCFLKKDTKDLWNYWQDIISHSSHYDFMIYLTSFKNDFDLLLLISKFIKKYTNDTVTALKYMKSAHQIIKKDNKSVFFHTMGEVYPEKANEFFRKELQILSSEGKEQTPEFADAIINVARTNDLVGCEGTEEIEDENEIEEIKERIKQDNKLKKQRDIADKQSLKNILGASLYKEYANVSEYHFDFEQSLWGNDLQLAYVKEAISIIKSIDVHVQYKIASYYSYIFEILWLCPPIDYYKTLEDSLSYFISLKTEECPEVIDILMQKSKFLCEEFYKHDKTDFNLFGDVISSQYINNVHNKLILICVKLYGEHSLQHIEALKEYAEFYDMTEDFDKELNCYNYIYTLYKEMGMHGEAIEIKEWIEHYCCPMAERHRE